MDKLKNWWQKSNKRELLLLALILLVALFLRLVNLDRSDMISDQAINSFRAIGLIDFLNSFNQSTPMQWYETRQWWQFLSFHDHPPLVFWVQHLFFRLIDVSVFTARLPFAIMGFLSVWMTYFLSRRIFNQAIGFLAAGLLAISNYHVWISRLGYLESFVILFIILSLSFGYAALKNKKYLYIAALFLGLGMLSKYTFVFMLPALLLFYLIYDKKVFTSKHFYGALILFLIIVSPIILYNFSMYFDRGHFDASLASMLGQHPEDFRLLTRTLEVSIFANIWSNIKTLAQAFNPIIFYGLIISLGYFIYRWWQAKNTKRFAIIFLPLGLLFVEMIFLTSAWYLTLFIPFLIIILAYSLYKLYLFINQKFDGRYSYLSLVFLLLVVYSLFYSLNTNLLYQTGGSSYWLYSNIRQENSGYNSLNNYLDEQLEGYKGNLFIDFYQPWPQVHNYQAQLQEQPLNYLSTGEQIADFIYVFDVRIDWFVEMWSIERRKLYQQFPFVTVEQFSNLLNSEGLATLQDNGISKYYFIYLTDNIKQDSKAVSPQGEALKEFLERNNIFPIKELVNSRGEVVFKIYQIPEEVLVK